MMEYGAGTLFSSCNSATNEPIWQGRSASAAEVQEAVKAGVAALAAWKSLSFEARASILHHFVIQLARDGEKLAEIISQEVGKPLWESRQEVEAMKNKIDISIRAFAMRCPEIHDRGPVCTHATRHLPHGLVAVFGPFNFPGHLPHGHIVPALLAGNTVLFKPSEKCPKTGEFVAKLWEKSGVPPGVFNLLQGPKEVAEYIVEQNAVKGIFFTGSYKAGKSILEKSIAFPDRIVALEMGGNNPLVVSQIYNLDAAVCTILQSAFITSGQRCTCARRLILIENDETQELIDKLVQATRKLIIGYYNDHPEPFLGPVISKDAANGLLAAQMRCLARGGKVLKELRAQGALVEPGIIDMTGCSMEDEEFFGPFLQIVRVDTLENAIKVANDTRYGLSAALLSEKEEEYRQFFAQVKAGVINWNMPTTGASSNAPFGGIKKSGNFRPSALYAADYAAYPVASQEACTLTLPEHLPPGMILS